MYALINYLENLDYVVRIRVNSNKQISGFFFMNEAAINEARRWPETVTIDATYKTNANRLSLINIVGTSNISTVKRGANHLQTFAIAAAFVDSETEESYTWVLQELREAVWPPEESFQLPSVIMTDNERALRNAIATVFPESQHFLCYWHLWNTMKLKLSIGTVDGVEFEYRRAQAEEQFMKVVSSYNLRTYQEAIGNLEQILSTRGYFKDDGALAMKYLKDE